MIRALFTAAFLLLLCPSAFAQHSSDTVKKIRFYLRCDCDFDFIRTAAPYVDYVRDPAEADVQGFAVKERAANGGQRHTYTFVGQKRFEGVNDTLRFFEKESDTPDEVRQHVLHTLTLGLARYVENSDEADRLEMSYKPPDTAAPISTVDPWDSWVFSTDIEAYVSGEQQHTYQNFWGSLSANRVTENWKMKLSANGSYVENNFKDLDLLSISRSASTSGLIVKSLSEHWSAGPSLVVSTSTYSNRRLQVEPMAGLEYDIFPYHESTSRQIRILYKIGIADFHYYDTTIYNKLQETLGSHLLSISTMFQQPWGSVEVTVAGAQYLSDLSKTELNIFANVQWKLIEGLSLRVVGNYASIHDQLSLPKGALSEDEVLLQRRQLATDYSYWSSVGLVYTFGSIYNNVVNPRFGD